MTRRDRLQYQRDRMASLREKRIREKMCASCGKNPKGRKTLTCELCAAKDRNKMRTKLGLRVRLEIV